MAAKHMGIVAVAAAFLATAGSALAQDAATTDRVTTTTTEDNDPDLGWLGLLGLAGLLGLRRRREDHTQVHHTDANRAGSTNRM